MNEQRVDRKSARIQVSAEEARKTAAAKIQQKHRESELAIERERQKLALQRERRIARQQTKREKRTARRHTREQMAARVNSAIPTVGRRAMIAGPILAPMTVAWIGQISFAMDTLGWIFLGALVFAAAWELTTAFTGWMYHQARKDGDRGTLFRVATWIFASSAGAMNYWHALDGGSIYHPTPKAVSYGTMSLVGIGLWELYSSLIHRKHLRAQGIVSSARPQFGILRWARFPRITWTAWSLAVRYGIKTVDEAWSAAVAEIARRDRAKAVASEQKRLAKDKRPAVRVVVARTVVQTVPPPKTTVRIYRLDRSSVKAVASTSGRTPTSDQQAVATTPPRGLPAPATTTATTGDQVDATTRNDHQRDRTRPPQKTTRKTGRDQADATTKPQPTTDDNKQAVAAYLQSVQDGRPLSKRALAKKFGFSPTWALARIQEAGPRPVGDAVHPSDHLDATTPEDHPATTVATSEVKTG